MADFMEQLNLSKDAPLMQAWMNCNSHRESMPIAEYLNPWYEAKSAHLLPMMGNELIYRERIVYEASSSQMQNTVDKWLDDSEHARVLSKLEDWFDLIVLNGIASWHAPHYFDDAAPRERASRFFCNAISSYSLARNSVQYEDYQGSSVSWTCPDNNRRVNISKGQKPFRLMGSILKNFKDVLMDKHGISAEEIADVEQELELLRIEHSQLFNNTSVSGNLCISIHPMDYMTMSDNDYNWNSCMSWEDNGCYHAGTLEMMNSKYVVVAYIDGSKPWYPCGQQYDTWSNKKWRELFIVTEDFISGIKAYPYYNDNLEEAVLQRLTAMAEKAFGWKYNATKRSNDNAMYINNTRIWLETNLMYNDTEGNEFNYRPTVNKTFYSDYAERMRGLAFDYSGIAYCTVCGETIGDEASTLCYEHSERVRCADCGEMIDREDAMMVDGDYYCSYCYDSHFRTCDECSSECDAQQLNRIFIARKRRDDSEYPFLFPYRYETFAEVCDDCFQSFLKEGAIVKTQDRFGDDIYVVADAKRFDLVDVEQLVIPDPMLLEKYRRKRQKQEQERLASSLPTLSF